MPVCRAFCGKDDGDVGWSVRRGAVQSTKRLLECFVYTLNAELGGKGQRMKKAKMAAGILA